MNFESAIQQIKGIGPKTAELFSHADIRNVGDLIHYYPRDYSTYKPLVNISDVQEGYWYAVKGRITGKMNLLKRGSRTVITGKLKDDTGSIMLTWYNLPFIRNVLLPGNTVVLWGRVRIRGANYVMEQPEYYVPEVYTEKLGILEPVYPLTAGLKNNMLIKALKQVLQDPEICSILQADEYLPKEIVRKRDLIPMIDAITRIHFPEDREEMGHARRRLAYEEFLLFILAFRYGKEGREHFPNQHPVRDLELVQKFRDSLPFKLTSSQDSVWQEICRDLKSDDTMNRLVQGDVGSGKTVVAVMAILAMIGNGYQGALMAPTEVLARQHYSGITRMLEKAGLDHFVKCGLLVGSMSNREKKIVRKEIETGSVSFVIGTHALIQEMVSYRNLGLVITDEQHRFGVRQREVFSEKGETPHVLVMSATPIPRTLALILYGDMDISVMNGLPGNRLPIKNCAVDTAYRPRAYSFMEKQIREGRQCYVICPMVEESENMDGEDVVNYSAKLREVFPPDIKIGMLHGRMSGSEKTRIMEDFAENKLQILVSTTVIEVGVDVPNATVMMIENAERFGLSTLHQLRGRVGRGGWQSYCILISSMEKPETRERLETLVKSNDGFYIAEEDLRLRGPGEFFGQRQSGELDFAIGDIYGDADLLKAAGEDADAILTEDPNLVLEKNEGIRNRIMHYHKEPVVL